MLCTLLQLLISLRAPVVPFSTWLCATSEEGYQAGQDAVPHPHQTDVVLLSPSHVHLRSLLLCSTFLPSYSLTRDKKKANKKPQTHSAGPLAVPTRLWQHSGLPPSFHHSSCQGHLGVSCAFVHQYPLQKCQGQADLCAVTVEDDATRLRATPIISWDSCWPIKISDQKWNKLYEFLVSIVNMFLAKLHFFFLAIIGITIAIAIIKLYQWKL